MERVLTFAIPFYSGIPFLREAIESVLAQHHTGWRCLVLDDGEVEQGARELVASFRDERIRYVKNEKNLGMVPNWNRCLDSAETDLVTILHADDRVLPSYARDMLDVALDHKGAAAFFCDAEVIDERGKRTFSFADAVKRFYVPDKREIYVLQGEAGVRAILRGNFIMCPTLCYRKSVLGDRRFELGWKQVQDLEFTTRLLMDGLQLVGLQRPLYAYRRHAGNATAVQSESMLRFDEEFELFDRLAGRLDALGWTSAAKTARRKTILKLHIRYRIAKDLLRLRTADARAKAEYLKSKA